MMTRNRKRRVQNKQEPNKRTKRDVEVQEEEEDAEFELGRPEETGLQETPESKQDGMVLRSRNQNKPRKVWTDDFDDTTYVPRARNDNNLEEPTQQRRAPKNRTKEKVTSKRVARLKGNNKPNKRKKALSEEDEWVSEAKSQPNVRRTASKVQETDATMEDDEAAASLMGLADLVLMSAQKEADAPKKNNSTSKVELRNVTNSFDDKNQIFNVPSKEYPIPNEIYDQSNGPLPVQLEPPTFTNLQPGGSVEPDIFFNRKLRSYKRCSAHVAIAYYTFYHQRCQMLQRVSGADSYARQYFFPLSLDPTFEARLLTSGAATQSRSSSPPSPAWQTNQDPDDASSPQERESKSSRKSRSPTPPAQQSQTQWPPNVPPVSPPVPFTGTSQPPSAAPKTPPSTIKPDTAELTAAETKLEDAPLDSGLFPRIIVNNEDAKLDTVVNPNLVATHEIRTTPISTLHMQLPSDQKEHTSYQQTRNPPGRTLSGGTLPPKPNATQSTQPPALMLSQMGMDQVQSPPTTAHQAAYAGGSVAASATRGSPANERSPFPPSLPFVPLPFAMQSVQITPQTHISHVATQIPSLMPGDQQAYTHNGHSTAKVTEKLSNQPRPHGLSNDDSYTRNSRPDGQQSNFEQLLGAAMEGEDSNSREDQIQAQAHKPIRGTLPHSTTGLVDAPSQRKRIMAVAQALGHILEVPSQSQQANNPTNNTGPSVPKNNTTDVVLNRNINKHVSDVSTADGVPVNKDVEVETSTSPNESEHRATDNDQQVEDTTAQDKQRAVIHEALEDSSISHTTDRFMPAVPLAAPLNTS